MKRVTVILLLLWGALASSAAFADDRLVMFAAASLKTALDAAAAQYHADGGAEVAISYGGSLALARQSSPAPRWTCSLLLTRLRWMKPRRPTRSGPIRG